MKVLFWGLNPVEAAATRIRLVQYFPLFEKNGIKCELKTFFSSPAQAILYHKGHAFKKANYVIEGWKHFVSVFKDVNDYDIIFISRECLPYNQSLAISYLKRIRKPILYDIDDAVFLDAPGRFLGFFQKPESIFEIVKLSHTVLAGNTYLLETLKPFNNNCHYVPSCVDPKEYGQRNEFCLKQEITLGWLGSHSTSVYLKLLKEPLEVLATKYKIKLILMGAMRDFDFKRVEVAQLPWSMQAEKQFLQSIDIGLYPLFNDKWVLGKCAFKAIQYLAAGVPCVASSIGANKEVIEDGVNGFLCSNTQEWVDKISTLIDRYSDLGKKFSSNGLKTVNEKFSIYSQLKLYLKLFDEALKRK